MRSPILVATLACTALVGCGQGDGKVAEDPVKSVRAVVVRFGEASAKKDYQAICDELITPGLVAGVEQVGLPCELAFKQGLGDVRAPTLKVLAVTVRGDRASARVTSGAAGQKPSTDVLRLQRRAGAWRIAALGAA